MSEVKIPPIEEFRDREPVERYKLGTIEHVQTANPEDFDIPAELAPGATYTVEVNDPYVEMLDEALVTYVKAREDQADAHARERREMGKWERRADTAYIDSEGHTRDKRKRWGDPVAHKEFFSELNSEALTQWLSHIPSANALTILSDPVTLEKVTGRDGKTTAEVDEVARLWLTACTDAQAIRNRGTVMAELVNAYVDEASRKGEVDKSHALKWMSVACGTALPAMKAAQKAGIKPEMLLVDIDKTALQSTQSLGAEIGYEGTLEQHMTNIFSSKDMAELRTYLGGNGGRPRIIDLMGIFEYTGEHTGIDPAEFLRSNYDMLHPGGRLILGQMRDDRPNPDFTMGVVGWPFIVMRSPAEVMQVIKDAGIPVDAAKLYVPQDGVYTVCAIDKPDGVESFAEAA